MHFPNERTNRNSRTRLSRLLLMLLALALVATACGGGDEADTDETPGDGEETSAAGDGGTITIGWIPWDEDIAATFLWKEILEREGYTVEETQLDVAPVFSGVADGSLDIFLDAWFPITHADYKERFGDDFVDLGIWNAPAKLTIAVPEYVEIDSLAELADNAEQFGSRIVGIEPGAGLTRVTREEVMPAYGLEDWELLESSTPAMLAELERAIEAEEPVVVTLWRPHWAYAGFPIKDLEDPEGALGAEEEIHALARTGFADDFPEVEQWLRNFELTADQLAELSQKVVDAGNGNEQQAAAEWIDENSDVVDGWLSS